MALKHQHAPRVENLLNLLSAMEPGGLERQEKHEQYLFTSSPCNLPIKVNGRCGTDLEAKEIYEKLGISVKGKATSDDLFYDVELPKGWAIKATGHPMWSDLVDTKGRVRLTIFFKSAFYDREAFVNLVSRFRIGYEPVVGYESPVYNELQHNRSDIEFKFYVFDRDSRVHESGPYLNPAKPAKDFDWVSLEELKETLKQECVAWLAEKYPDYENPFAYWEQS